MQRSPTTTSLFVPDVAATLKFYEDVLGFAISATWQEDGRPLWGEVVRELPDGPARLWFFAGELPGRPTPELTGLIYVFVDDVDAEAMRLKDKVKVLWGPEDQVYGIRELGIEDLNGYMLCFAKDLD